MDELKPRDVLGIIRRVAIFNGGHIADDLDQVEQLLTGLFKSCRLISADLEHALIFCPDSPLRQDVDNLDAWLAAVHAPTDIEAKTAPARPREDSGEVDEWRPIETAPRDGAEVLVWCPEEALVPLAMQFSSREYFLREYGDADYMEEGWYLFYSYPDGMHEETCRPTHWKPFNRPPALAAALGKSNG